ncbi:MAG: cation:proton antiporter [Acidimicrobiia bacterium]|nr:cation:proton antiporter [Acidimicrobiia bacterium]NNF64488.1 cation:proton antiporter [Acidimicrobiia bacterium]
MQSVPADTLDAPAAGWPLIIIGACLLIGFVAHVAGQRAHIPRVTLLLLLGFLVGPSGFQLIPPTTIDWLPLAAQVALSMIGFELGERFLGQRIRTTGRVVLAVAVVVTLGTALVVFVGLLLAGVPVVLSLLLAGMSTATDPAATVDVIRETRSKGSLTDIVLGVVAIDDAFGIILFGILVVIASGIGGDAFAPGVIGLASWELGGGLLVGLVFGLPMALLTGRIRSGELTLIETLGFVLCASGAASLLGVSYLIAAMTQGAIVANFARHHSRPFHAIKNIRQPFLIVFFLLAGLRLDLAALKAAGIIALAYVIARSIGRVACGTLGAQVGRADQNVRRYVGLCLLPQAGVALGLGLLAAEEFPEFGDRLLSLLIGTTVVFEVVGPIVTRVSLRLAGEAESQSAVPKGDLPA